MMNIFFSEEKYQYIRARKTNHMKTLLSLALVLACFTSFTQVTTEKRIEFEQSDEFDIYGFTEFGENGLVILSSSNKTNDKQKAHRFEYYSSDLELEDEIFEYLPKGQFLDERYESDEFTHAFFLDKKGNYSLITIEGKSFSKTVVMGILPKKAVVKEMVVVGNWAYFNAVIKKKPYLFGIHWREGDQQLIPISAGGQSIKKLSINDIQAVENGLDEVFVYIDYRESNQNLETYVLHLNDQAEKIDTYHISKGLRKNLISTSASRWDENSFLLTGTYATNSTTMAEGLFIYKVSKEGKEFIQYYNFLDLEDFTSYLSEKKQEKIEKKKAKKEKKGKELSIMIRMTNHDIRKVGDDFIVLGEAYYPTYRTETRTTTTYVNGQPQTRTETVRYFDGYQYTHALAARFDSEGNLLWDKVLKMYPSHKPFYVKKFISVDEDNLETLDMLYVNESEIVSLSISYNGVILSERSEYVIEGQHEGDKAKKTSGNVFHWYDNYFITHGEQVLKNKEDEDVDRKRKVYFVNKITF